MKKTTLLILISFLLVITSCKNIEKKAINYNERIVQLHYEILKLEYDLINNLFEGSDTAEIATLVANYNNELNEKLQYIKKIKAFDKEDELRLSLIDLVESMIQISNNEYKELAQILKTPIDTTVNSYKIESKLKEITTNIDNKSKIANQKFLDAQTKFANKYNLAFR